MISSISKYSNSFMTILLLVIFTAMVAVSSRYPAGARFMTFVVGFPAIALCILQLFLDARERRQGEAAQNGQGDLRKAEEKVSKAVGHAVHFDIGSMMFPDADGEEQGRVRREFEAWAYFLGLIVGIIFFGFHLAVLVFLLVFLRVRAKASWVMTLGLTAAAVFALFYAFEHVLRVSLHSGFITDFVRERLGYY